MTDPMTWYRFSVDAERKLVVVTVRGDLNPVAIRRFRRELEAHPDFKPSMAQLADLRDANGDQAFAFLRELLVDDPFGSGARRACVVARDVDFGMMRVYGAHAESKDMEFVPFRSLPEACEWLGVPLDAVERILG